ncbi:YmdB family metallophosphoesterase [bacterium]|nr:YmdB family metallophosphoesterase [bacterium]
MIKILFLGDITGRQGRTAVKSYIASLKENNEPDFIIANIENASHGFGLTKKNYVDLSENGIDCFTSGNHIWDKKDIYEYIDEAENLIRPINYPKGTKGIGSRIFEIKGQKLGVINALGRVFMPPIDSPWQVVTDKIREMKSDGVEHIIIDFHAEATAEKICFSKYLAKEFNNEENAIIKGFFGTHTHVQTADEQIYDGMGYITDAGFCGSIDSVIGMEFETSMRRLSTSLPERYEIAESSLAQINGVEIFIDRNKTTQIKRINVTVDNNGSEGVNDG